MAEGGVPQEMEAAIEYRAQIKKVRGWCVMLGFFGALAVWQGIQLLEAGPVLGFVGIAIGGVLLVAALVAGLKPSPATMVAEAGAFGLIAVWDLSLTFLSGGEQAGLGIWALVEIGIAIYLLVSLPKFLRAARRKPAPEVLAELDNICEEIRKAKPKEDPTILDVVAGTKQWRLRLAGDVATVVERQKGHDIFFVPREEVTIEDNTKPGKEDKKRPVTIQMGEKQWKCKLKPEELERLTAWREGTDREEPEPEQTPQTQPPEEDQEQPAAPAPPPPAAEEPDEG